MVRRIEPHVARGGGGQCEGAGRGLDRADSETVARAILAQTATGVCLRVCGLLLSAGAELNVGATVAVSDEDQGEHQA
jgi:hypothetical protein